MDLKNAKAHTAMHLRIQRTGTPSDTLETPFMGGKARVKS